MLEVVIKMRQEPPKDAHPTPKNGESELRDSKVCQSTQYSVLRNKVLFVFFTKKFFVTRCGKEI